MIGQDGAKVSTIGLGADAGESESSWRWPPDECPRTLARVRQI